jgi:transketolase
MGDHGRQLILDLEAKAKLFRREILEMTFKAGSGHPGGSMSAVDIITALYFHQMKVDPVSPRWEDRDRFVLSKGHVCPALYAVLAEKGFFPKEALWTLRLPESILQGHPDMRLTPGVEMSTGSLGQGLSVACGMALAARIDEKDYNVYCMLGDGEVQEGNVWTGAMFAAHERLDNLIAILDRNRLQIEGFTEDVMSLAPLADERQGKPKIIIANTIKGKGVSFMENQAEYHGRALSPDEMERARQELEIPGFKVE